MPYETVEGLDGIELRRYPRTVLVETTAPSRKAAFGRLYRYITGANEGSEEVAMTAPVATREVGTGLAMTTSVRTGGAAVAMTAPVRTRRNAGMGGKRGAGGEADEDDGGVTMAFYLPSSYAPESAPVPTDPEVRLVVEPARTVAVRGFSWWTTRDRVDRARGELLDAVAEHDLETRGEPYLLQYDPPWTLPFLRTNEVVVGVET